MKKIICLFVLLILVSAQGLKSEAEVFLKSRYGNEIELRNFKVTLQDQMINKIQEIAPQKIVKNEIEYWVFKRDNKNYHAFLDHVMGKTNPISYLVVVGDDFRVVHIEILQYRNHRGHEVKEQSWLKQFYGKKTNDNFKVGDDVQGISGATISSNALTNGVKKIIFLAEKYVSTK